MIPMIATTIRSSMSVKPRALFMAGLCPRRPPRPSGTRIPTAYNARTGHSMTLPAGARLGPYEIVDLIGLGGMGEVHRARDTRLARDGAVKILPASMCEDQDRLRRFEQEAWAAGVLNHPNVVAVYDIGTHERMPYVVTELLEGESLRARLAGGPLPVRKSVEYAVQIAHGLAAAHDKG